MPPRDFFVLVFSPLFLFCVSLWQELAALESVAPFICGAVAGDAPLFPGETFRGTLEVDEEACPDAVYSAVTMLSELLGRLPRAQEWAPLVASFVLPSSPVRSPLLAPAHPKGRKQFLVGVVSFSHNVCVPNTGSRPN